jgi:sugar/nucleoside kinase (ribokinase family)
VSRPTRALSATVIGGASWNRLVDVPRLPTDLTTLSATATRQGIGGTGAGKSLNLARLGVRTRLHALLGDDPAGGRVRAELEAAGVELTWWPDPAGTEEHLNLTDPRGDRLSIFLSESSSDPSVTAEELCELARGTDLIFVSLTHYARRVLPLLAAQALPVWVDLHDWDGRPSELHSPFVEHGTYVFMSDARLDDPLATASRLAHDRPLVVVTHGRRGATAFFPDREPLFIPPYDAGPPLDPNGAGDAFAVGVAYGRAQGWDWPECLRAGAVLGGGCVTSPEIADPALTRDWLRGRLGDRLGDRLG